MESINKNKIKKYAASALIVASLLLPKGITALEVPEEHLDKWCPLNKILGVEHQIDKINSLPGYTAKYSSDGIFDASKLENGKYYVIYNDGTTKEYTINNAEYNGENLPSPIHFSENDGEVILIKTSKKDEIITDNYENGMQKREETTSHLQNGNIESVIKVYDENGNLKSELKQIHDANDNLIDDNEIIYDADKKR